MTQVENGIIKPKTASGFSYIKADKLEAASLEPPAFIVEKILPTGLCIFSAPIKYGKSWCVLDLCLSVSTGTNFLGFKTEKSDALYLALEDSNIRLQDRMKKVLGRKAAPNGLGFSIHAGTLQNGLIEQLTNYIEDNPKTRLIVIDTFQMIRDGKKRGESAYSADYRDCAQLKAFADNYKICLVLVHHMRKMRDLSDNFMNISGTAGISGAADTIITMSRNERSSDHTLLSLTGRDIETQEYQIEFNKSTFKWNVLGTSEEMKEMKAIEEYKNNPLILTINSLVKQNKGVWTGSSSEIIKESVRLKAPIRESAQRVGKMIEQYQDILFEQDGIIYTPIKNGSGAKKHSFHYHQ